MANIPRILRHELADFDVLCPIHLLELVARRRLHHFRGHLLPAPPSLDYPPPLTLEQIQARTPQRRARKKNPCLLQQSHCERKDCAFEHKPQPQARKRAILPEPKEQEEGDAIWSQKITWTGAESEGSGSAHQPRSAAGAPATDALLVDFGWRRRWRGHGAGGTRSDLSRRRTRPREESGSQGLWKDMSCLFTEYTLNFSGVSLSVPIDLCVSAATSSG